VKSSGTTDRASVKMPIAPRPWQQTSSKAINGFIGHREDASGPGHKHDNTNPLIPARSVHFEKHSLIVNVTSTSNNPNDTQPNENRFSMDNSMSAGRNSETYHPGLQGLATAELSPVLQRHSTPSFHQRSAGRAIYSYQQFIRPELNVTQNHTYVSQSRSVAALCKVRCADVFYVMFFILQEKQCIRMTGHD
jgi:hypothetical protein